MSLQFVYVKNTVYKNTLVDSYRYLIIIILYFPIAVFDFQINCKTNHPDRKRTFLYIKTEYKPTLHKLCLRVEKPILSVHTYQPTKHIKLLLLHNYVRWYNEKDSMARIHATQSENRIRENISGISSVVYVDDNVVLFIGTPYLCHTCRYMFQFNTMYLK